MLAGIAEAPNGDLRLLARGMRWVGRKLIVVGNGTGWPFGRKVMCKRCLRRKRWAQPASGFIRILGETLRRGRATTTGLWIAKLQIYSASAPAVPYYGALIFSPRPRSLAFTGHLQREGGGCAN